MIVSKDNKEIRNRIIDFENGIEAMHLEFQKYRRGDAEKMPEWEKFEMELLNFSRKKIYDLQLSKNLDRVMFKFQNRKKIWLKWVDEYHHVIK